MKNGTPPLPAQSGAFRRRARRIAVVLIWVVTLIAFFYAEENWRGRRAWRRYRQRLEAQGTPVTLASLIPKPVPDAENFAMTPALAPLFDFVPGTQHFRDTNGLARIQNEPPNYKEASNSLKEGQREGDWARGVSINLQGWARGFDPTVPVGSGGGEDRAAAAKAVLAGLEEWTPLFDEARAAAKRPYSRFNIRYEEENTAGILLPHLSVLKRWVDVLKLRASAELAVGQTGRAFDDLAFRLTDAVKDEPILITRLIRMAELRLILQPVWEGMKDGKWSVPQLEALQQRLSGFDILSEAKKAFADDRAGIGNSSIEFVRQSPSKRADMLGLFDSVNGGAGYSAFGSIFLQFIPSGWFYAEELEYNRIYDRFVMPLIDVTNRRVSPELAQRNKQEIDTCLERSPGSLLWEHRLFARLLIPAVSGLVSKVARTQTAIDLGVTAWALERYRLANGQYPENLAKLVPAFLPKTPTDVIDGQPLRYRPAGGRFVLYSVGWNGKDDGGEYPSKSDGSMAPMRGTGDDQQASGDWVWRYPPANL